MVNEVWKEYEENQLTHSSAHYLMTIHHLLAEHGYARVTDVARQLGITRGSCSISLKVLKRKRLVLEDKNKFLRLSDEGVRLASLVEQNDKLLEFLFQDILGVDSEQAKIDACKIEHLLSLETSQQLAGLVKYFSTQNKTIKQFKKELHKASVACEHDTGNCGLCESVCLYDGSAHN